LLPFAFPPRFRLSARCSRGFAYFPSVKLIFAVSIYSDSVTGWQVLPADAQDFEEAALHACDFVLAGGS